MHFENLPKQDLDDGATTEGNEKKATDEKKQETHTEITQESETEPPSGDGAATFSIDE